MNEKIKPEHSEETVFDAGWSGMAETISSADVAERPRFVQGVLGRAALRTAPEKTDTGRMDGEGRLDEDEISAIIAAEEGGKAVEIGEDAATAEALERAFGEPDQYVREVMGEELVRAEAEALRLAREQSAGTYFGFISDTAAIHGLLPDNLLGVVRKDVKGLMYSPERLATTMFAMTVSEQDLEQLVRAGRLEREAGEYEATISNLRLKEYQNAVEGGEGSSDELKTGEVRLLFDGRLVGEESFDCLLKEPTVDEVKLQECVGVMVKGGAEEKEKWAEQLRGREVALPVQSEELLGGTALSLELLAVLKRQEEEYIEQRREERRLEREALTGVDQDKVAETVRQYTDRLSDETMDELFFAYQKSETPEDFRAAEKRAHGEICKAFGIEEESELKYVYEPGTKEKPAVSARTYKDPETGKWVCEINEYYRKMGDASASMDALGRENFHIVQNELCERADKDPESLSEGERERVAVYQWNKAHFVSPEVDCVGHLEQVIENEALEAGAQCRDGLFRAFERNRSALTKGKVFAWIRNQTRAKAEGEKRDKKAGFGSKK